MGRFNKSATGLAMQDLLDKENGIAYSKVLPEFEIITKHKAKNPITNKISEVYQQVSDSPIGLGYDVLNAGLYIAAPFTGGTTLIPAMAMTGALAVGAAANLYEMGLNENNALDILSAIPGFGITEKLAKRGMVKALKASGKSTKYAKHFSKYSPYIIDAALA